jgi:transposase
VSTLNSLLSEVTALINFSDLKIVMDKGFCSGANIDSMLKNGKANFVMAMPFTFSIVKKRVKKNLVKIGNSISIGSDFLYSEREEYKWGNHTTYIYSFYNDIKFAQTKSELTAYVNDLYQRALVDPLNDKLGAEFKKYLNIRKTKDKYNIKIKKRVISKELQNVGRLIIISNQKFSSKEVVEIYRTKDVVEKAFLRIKKNLNLKRLRVHYEETMQGKTFVIFLALIIISHIHNIMKSKILYKDLTIKELIRIVSKLKILRIKNSTTLSPITKQQKEIFEAFDIKLPSVC